ncbi:MAG: hypothetical protein FJ333_02225 [Sphingomonadales bacterium]|nr:hypothetical protein [Sphingomonadales bacterium]
MNHPFKPQLLREKEFLKSLYNSESVAHTKNILTFASDVKLNTLVKLVHFISNGVIKVRKEDFEAIGKANIHFIRAQFETKDSLKKLLHGNRQVKLQVLLRLKKHYHSILFTCFNQIM